MSKLNSLGIFVEAKERYEQEVKAAQTSSWKGFCQTQDRETAWDGIYRVLRGTQPRQEDQPLIYNQKPLTPHESAELMARTFFLQDSEDDDNDHHNRVKERTGNLNKRRKQKAIATPFLHQRN